MEEYFIEPPFDYSVSLLDFFCDRKFDKKGFIASIFYLELKKLVKIDFLDDTTAKFTIKKDFEKKLSDIEGPEYYSFHFLKELIAKERKQIFTLQELFEKAIDSKEYFNRKELKMERDFNTKYYLNWRRAVIDELTEKEFGKMTNPFIEGFRPSFSAEGAVKLTILLVLFSAVFYFLISSIPAAQTLTVELRIYISMAIAFFIELLIMAVENAWIFPKELAIREKLAQDQIRKLEITPKGAKELQEWQKYMDFLLNYSKINEKKGRYFKLWDKHFCYAMALGLTETIE